MIYWLTGQPGAGKTTLAKYLVEYFPKDKVTHIDGDDLRDIFKNKDYSITGRRLNIQRAQYIAQFMHQFKYYTNQQPDQGVVDMVAKQLFNYD